MGEIADSQAHGSGRSLSGPPLCGDYDRSGIWGRSVDDRDCCSGKHHPVLVFGGVHPHHLVFAAARSRLPAIRSRIVGQPWSPDCAGGPHLPSNRSWCAARLVECRNGMDFLHPRRIRTSCASDAFSRWHHRSTTGGGVFDSPCRVVAHGSWYRPGSGAGQVRWIPNKPDRSTRSGKIEHLTALADVDLCL